jgi:processive 1,2-diacylglycerol beta-glucosyltransferase
MYISEVSGHRSAAEAIEKAIKVLQPDSETLSINAFNYTNPISEKIINSLYMGVIKRAPRIWSYLYDNQDIVKGLEKIRDSIHKFNSPKLKNLFARFKPDVAACTQAFPCGMVADYKKAFNARLPLVAILTDYVPHSYWIYDSINFYITPAEDVSFRLMQKGVPASKIKSLGIPFEPKFNETFKQDKIFQKLKLNPQLPTVLIMGGGQGLGPIKTIVKSLEKVNRQIQEIVVCGTNKKLYNSLKPKIKKYRQRILIFGYTHHISELMSISDIIITKPGGVTTAEVLCKKIPMIIVKPLPGQEVNNTDYLTQKGAAIKLDNPVDINLTVEDLFLHPFKLNRMRDCINRIRKPNSSFDIARLILNLT